MAGQKAPKTGLSSEGGNLFLDTVQIFDLSDSSDYIEKGDRSSENGHHHQHQKCI